MLFIKFGSPENNFCPPPITMLLSGEKSDKMDLIYFFSFLTLSLFLALLQQVGERIHIL